MVLNDDDNENENVYASIRQSNTFAVRLWLDNVTNDIHQIDEHGFTLLHWAAWHGRLQIVQLLIQRGARVNAVNRGDDTPLHLAASHNHLNIVQYLTKHKAHVNAINIHGNTALHYACFHSFTAIGKFLIEAHGTSLFVANRYGQTPLDLCSSPETRLVLADLAKEQGQDESIIPFEEHDRFSTMPIFDVIGRSPAHSLIDIRELNFEHCLQSNHRHETWQGNYNDTPIIAKIFKLRHISYKSRLFQHEIDKLRIFNSPHILVPFAVCHDAPNLILITRSLYGNQTLFHLLHETSLPIDSIISLKWTLDIGRGMAFLHGIVGSFRPQFILNSHHIVINEDYVIRLNMADCQFSFMSNVNIDQPGWVAPEVLEQGISTNASDIWSFAIVLWEIFTRRIPFDTFSPMQCGLKIVQERLHLSPLSASGGVSAHIDKLIRLCTHNDPTKRPSFDAILPIVEKMRA